MSQSTALCQSGCGFYGNAATDGLCSKCYKDAVMRKQTVPGSAPNTSSSCSASSVTDMTQQSSSSPSATPLLPHKPPPAASVTDLTTAAPTVAPFPAPTAQLTPQSQVSRTCAPFLSHSSVPSVVMARRKNPDPKKVALAARFLFRMLIVVFFVLTWTRWMPVGQTGRAVGSAIRTKGRYQRQTQSVHRITAQSSV